MTPPAGPVFPGAPLVHADRAVVQDPSNSSVTGQITVLVVDDDPSIRRLIVASLKREGYSFLEAANGLEALDMMRNYHPHVVVLDLMMPVVSGWDVLNQRQGDPQLLRIPVIIISANRDANLAAAVDKNVAAFLPKPFDITALNALVKSFVA